MIGSKSKQILSISFIISLILASIFGIVFATYLLISQMIDVQALKNSILYEPSMPLWGYYFLSYYGLILAISLLICSAFSFYYYFKKHKNLHYILNNYFSGCSACLFIYFIVEIIYVKQLEKALGTTSDYTFFIMFPVLLGISTVIFITSANLINNEDKAKRNSGVYFAIIGTILYFATNVFYSIVVGSNWAFILSFSFIIICFLIYYIYIFIDKDFADNTLKSGSNSSEESKIKSVEDTSIALDNLKKLNELKNSGAISEEEYEEKKKNLLEKIK